MVRQVLVVVTLHDGEEPEMGSSGRFAECSVTDYFARASSTPRSGGHRKADCKPFLSATGRGVGKPPATVPKVKRPAHYSKGGTSGSSGRLSGSCRRHGRRRWSGDEDIARGSKESQARDQRSTSGSPVGCLCPIRGASEGPFVKSRRSLSEGPGRARKVRAGVARGRGEVGTTLGRSIRVVACTEYERHGSFRRRVEPPTKSDGNPESGGVSGSKQERHLGGVWKS